MLRTCSLRRQAETGLRSESRGRESSHILATYAALTGRFGCTWRACSRPTDPLGPATHALAYLLKDRLPVSAHISAPCSSLIQSLPAHTLPRDPRLTTAHRLLPPLPLILFTQRPVPYYGPRTEADRCARRQLRYTSRAGARHAPHGPV